MSGIQFLKGGEEQLKVAVYTRVSTKKSEQESSIKLQKEVYEQYCKEKGYELHKIYADKETATNVRSRADFISLLHDAGLDYVRGDNEEYDTFKKSKRKPKIDLIIVKDVARWSRSTHLGMLIVEYLRDKKVYVLFESAGLNTKDDDWHMRLSMLFTIAQNESHNLSRRIKFSRKHNAKKGRYVPSRLSYGYVRNENNEIVIHKEEAVVVRKIFELYKEHGGGIISQMLNEEGYKSQNGYAWSPDKVLRVVKNKLYTGTAVVNKSVRQNVTDTYRIDVPKEEWIEIPNAVEPIISLQTWEEANSKRKMNINHAAGRGRKPATNDVFFMKIYCRTCGARFVRHQGRNNENSKIKLSYMCQTRRKKNGIEYCNARAISFNILNEMIDEIDIASLFNTQADTSNFDILMKKIDEEASSMQERINEYTAQIEVLEAENDKITNAIVDGIGASSQATIDALSKKIEANTKKIEEIASHRAKTNITVINTLKSYVNAKMEAISSLKCVPNVREWKLRQLKEIRVDEFEVTFEFNLLSLELEIEMFNTIFPNSAIEQENEYKPFTVTLRRDHKQAREYWEKVDAR